jgi:hypothetical protein
MAVVSGSLSNHCARSTHPCPSIPCCIPRPPGVPGERRPAAARVGDGDPLEPQRRPAGTPPARMGRASWCVRCQRCHGDLQDAGLNPILIGCFLMQGRPYWATIPRTAASTPGPARVRWGMPGTCFLTNPLRAHSANKTSPPIGPCCRFRPEPPAGYGPRPAAPRGLYRPQRPPRPAHRGACQ